MTVLPPLPDKALRLYDDFTLPTLDPTIWTTKVDKKPGRSGVQFRDDLVTVDSSHLRLSVCPQATAGAYWGGEVTTLGKLEFTYGRVEVNAQLPPCTVPGLQQTFWLWPVNALKYGPWPLSGEVDFAEFFSLYPDYVCPSIHYAPNLPLPARHVSPQAGFRRYQVDWRPGVITLAVDDVVIETCRYRPLNVKSPAPFDQPCFLVLTQTVGIGRNAPTSQTPFPATTRIDYVKIWK